MTNRPQTLQQSILHFGDKDVAQQYLVDLRWRDVPALRRQRTVIHYHPQDLALQILQEAI